MRRVISIVAGILAAAASSGAAQDAAPPRPVEPAKAAELGHIGRLIARAQPGDTINIPAGVYRERVRIDKPVSIVGAPGAVIDGGGSGDIIEVVAPDVHVRGFIIRDTGIDLDKENAAIRVVAPRAVIENNTLEDVLFGIDLREAPGSIIRGNIIGGKRLDIARRGDGIRLWRADGAVVERNDIHDGRDAILWYSTGVAVRNNTSHHCRYGFHLMYCDEVTLENNELTGNSVGIYIMYSTGITMRGNRLVQNRGPSGYGLGLKEAGAYKVENNSFVGNRVGIYLDGSPFSAATASTITRNIIACNDVGMTFLPSCRGNTVVENSFIDNIEQVSVSGRGELANNAFSAASRGNFWSDYIGYDQDADGVGDFVHESRTLFESFLDREPKLRLLMFSPAQQAVEFVGRAIPAVRPEPKFSDEYPLMRPIQGAGAPVPPRARAWKLSLVGAGLMGLGLALVRLARSPSTISCRRADALSGGDA